MCSSKKEPSPARGRPEKQLPLARMLLDREKYGGGMHEVTLRLLNLFFLKCCTLTSSSLMAACLLAPGAARVERTEADALLKPTLSITA